MNDSNTPLSERAGLDLGQFVARRRQFTLGPVDFEVPLGSTLALVGPNGAGKTTLLRALLGQLPSNGQVKWHDENVWDLTDPSWRSIVGYVPDDPNEILEECTGQEYWAFAIGIRLRIIDRAARGHAAAAMLNDVANLQARLTLTPDDSSPIAEYSLGMKKKTQLISVLATRPEIVIMDEPRNGLDPIGILQLEEILNELRESGKAVLIATHDIDWALKNSDHILGLRDGTVAFNDTTVNLRTRGVDGIVEMMR